MAQVNSTSIARTTPLPCSGCGACVAECGRDAITLALNEYGFLEASVNAAKCVDCGACSDVCARFTTRDGCLPLNDAKLWAAQSATPEVLSGSTSGGIAHELARLALSMGYKAAGVVYDSQTRRAIHSIIQSADGTGAFDGSKYLQSDPSQAWRAIYKTLAADPSARFIAFGMPCQIAGLSRVLEKHSLRERCILVELFCHGIPSRLVWERYLLEKERVTGPSPEVLFRNKQAGWHTYRLTLTGPKGSADGFRERDAFWQLFFDDICLNDACYSCRERGETSCADIRLGDFWGSRFASREDGVSAVFAVTPAGRDLIEMLFAQNRAMSLGSFPPADALSGQSLAPRPVPAARGDALASLRAGTPLCDIIKEYRRTFPPKRRLKLFLLTASGLLPVGVRRQLRRMRRG